MNHVNVLLATFNGIDHLDEQIKSISIQKNVEVSLFIHDDGSIDGTVDYLKQLNPNGVIKHLHIHYAKKQLGASSAFLFLLKTCLHQTSNAKHAFFAFCDQDDVWLSDKLSTAINVIQKNSSSTPCLYGTRTELVDDTLTHIGYSPLFNKKPHFKNALVQNIMGGNTMVFNFQAAKLIMPDSNQTFSVAMHDHWAYIIVSGAGGTIIYDQNPKVRYRQHKGNLLGSNMGLRAKWSRVKRLFQGEFKMNNQLNLDALEQHTQLLTKQNQLVLDLYKRCCQSSSFLERVRYLRQSKVHRQSLMQNVMLLIACIYKKL